MPLDELPVMPTTHILFDFFGTLVNYSKAPIGAGYEATFAHIEQAGYTSGYDAFIQLWSQTYQEMDREALLSHREFSMDELALALVDRALGKTDPALSRAIAGTYISEWNRGITYLPGLEALLSTLSEHFVLGVVSNTHEEALVPGHLASMGVSGLFRTVITSVEFGIRKPNRAIFDHAVNVLDTTPDQCIYVGDNYEADFRGANAAGIKAYLIDPDGKAPVPHHARIDSVHSLTRHLLT